MKRYKVTLEFEIREREHKRKLDERQLAIVTERVINYAYDAFNIYYDMHRKPDQVLVKRLTDES